MIILENGAPELSQYETRRYAITTTMCTHMTFWRAGGAGATMPVIETDNGYKARIPDNLIANYGYIEASATVDDGNGSADVVDTGRLYVRENAIPENYAPDDYESPVYKGLYALIRSMQSRMDAGEFKGNKGDKGDPAPDDLVVPAVNAYIAEYIRLHPEATIDEDIIRSAVNAWLENHPEATTTVQDDSLTEAKFSPKVRSDIYGTEREFENLLYSISAVTTTKYINCDFKEGDKVRITAPSPTDGSSVKEQLTIGYVAKNGTKNNIFKSTDLNEEVDVVYEFVEDAVQIFTQTWNWNNVNVKIYSITKEFVDGLMPDINNLKNTFVTPQMYGAKADGVTDDTAAIQKALDESNCVYIPHGVYLTSDTLWMHSNQTIFGCGRESKIINTVLSGDNKTIIKAGEVLVGSNTHSYLLLTASDCSINTDNKSVTVNSADEYSVGDIVMISSKDFDGNKNPKYYWNAKITDISNGIISLDTYIENEYLLSEECVIRNMSRLPVGYDVKENVCIHDLSLEHKYYDSGSGMYCIGLSVYRGSVYNVWTKGNTAIGANYAVNVVIDNIVAEFDGGFCDIPEINQNVVIQNSVGNKYGNRLNVIGCSFLQGYGVVIKNNRITFDGHGSVKVGAHINPTIIGNELRNVGASDPPIYLSKYGNSILRNNVITGSKLSISQQVVYQNSNGNIIEGNIIKNAKDQRWLFGFNTFDTDRNRIVDNTIVNDFTSDNLYDIILGDRLMTSATKHLGLSDTKTLNPNTPYHCFETRTNEPIPRRLKYYKFMFSEECNVELGFVLSDGTVTKTSITGVSVLDVYVPRNNYINYIKNGSSSHRFSTGRTNDYTSVQITVKSDKSVTVSGFSSVLVE